MFELAEEYKMLQAMVRELVEREVKPQIEAFEQKSEFPAELVRRLGELGFMGITIPEKYGGAGMDTLSYAIAEEEIASVWASLGLIMSANNSLSCAPIFEWGNEKQKQQYLVPLASGQKLGCYALTESDAGSDAANQKTIARRSGKYYVISGTKRLITNASRADICILIARTGEDRHRGLSAFIVETATPGFKVARAEDKMGLRCAPTCEVVLEECRAPKENLLGGEGNGWNVAMKTLNGGRINIAAQAVGIAAGALKEAIKHSCNRRQFGRSIADFQMIQAMLADMETQIEAARLLTWKAAWLKDRGLPEKELAPHTAKAKLFASEMAERVASNALQIFGGDGYVKGLLVERAYRDAKATQLYEGTSQVQRIIIAKSLLRELRAD